MTSRMSAFGGFKRTAQTFLSRAWIAFRARTEREQWLLAGLALVLLAAAFTFLVWRPILEARTTSLRDIRQHAVLQSRIELAKNELGQGASTVQPVSFNESAAAFGLEVQRNEPDGAGTQISFKNVDFSNLLRWAAQVETQGQARITAFRAERQPEPGRVNASVTFASQGAGP